MLFNSYVFIFVFFPLVLLGYGILQSNRIGLKKEGSKEKVFLLVLLVMSLIFYGYMYPACVWILLISMGINLALAFAVQRQKGRASSKENTNGQRDAEVTDTIAGSKKLLILGVVFNVAMLAVFKYFKLTAPGISFFTFTQIAFLTECYKGKIKEIHPLEYGLYVSFFPKLIQGPIALPEDMLSQFRSCQLKADWERIYRGLYLFVLGLFKKVILADTLGGAVDYGYTNLAALNSGDAWIVMLSYTLQLYFDFSGYCDMAMGIAQMLGFELPLNFNSPYKAADIIEFWDRWHITLTKFFTKYIYIPLGGSRKGKVRTYVNCLIVFFVSGLWHGTGWQFLVWGMMHGVMNVFTRMWKEHKQEKRIAWKLPRFMGVVLTFLYVNAAWVFFRAPSVREGSVLLLKLVRPDFGRINWDLAGCFNLDEFWYVIKVLGLDGWQYGHYILMVLILVALLVLVFAAPTAITYVKKVKPGTVHVMIMAVLFIWSVLALSKVSSFLYFNF